MINLARLKERVEKATAGPWEVDVGASFAPFDDFDLFYARGPIIKGIPPDNAKELAKLDAEFICSARTDIPKLIEAIEILAAAMSENRSLWGQVPGRGTVQAIEARAIIDQALSQVAQKLEEIG